MGETWRAFLLAFAILIAAGPAPIARAQPPPGHTEPEHLPGRSKPPPPGIRPLALPAYGARLGVPARTEVESRFDRIVDEYVLFHLRLDPVWATNVGLHDYDALLPETDSTAIVASIAKFEDFLARLEKLDTERLGRERRFDQALLTNRIRGRLLDLKTVETWKRDPGSYLSIVTESLDGLLEREYAPLADRTWNVIARLQKVPGVLRDARRNLRNPPRVHTEIAIEQAAEVVRFLSNQLPVRVAPLSDPVLGEEFDHHLDHAVSIAADYYDWLRSDLLPRSNGPLALGADTYARALVYDEGIGAAPESLFRRAEEALHQSQRRLSEQTNAIEPGISVGELRRRLAEQGPQAKDLLYATEGALMRVQRFLDENAILSPEGPAPFRVVETPEFRRSATFASLDAPGALESASEDACCFVSPPDEQWPTERQAEHLGNYNPYELEWAAIHEALPGRYAQSLARRRCPSLVRALFGSTTDFEGWAGYAEEMMLGEGYGSENPRYRFARLDRALLEDCRLLASLSVHTRGATFEDAVRLFEREAFLARADAVREARRAVHDRSSSFGTLEKQEILALRAQVARQEGTSFRLREFHDRFLAYGGAPVALIRDDWRHSP
ncbi:MAG: DUF885 domain-containing protein [Candidatus Eiseniibacteriota bacterium]